MLTTVMESAHKILSKELIAITATPQLNWLHKYHQHQYKQEHTAKPIEEMITTIEHVHDEGSNYATA